MFIRKIEEGLEGVLLDTDLITYMMKYLYHADMSPQL